MDITIGIYIIRYIMWSCLWMDKLRNFASTRVAKALTKKQQRFSTARPQIHYSEKKLYSSGKFGFLIMNFEWAKHVDSTRLCVLESWYIHYPSNHTRTILFGRLVVEFKKLDNLIICFSETPYICYSIIFISILKWNVNQVLSIDIDSKTLW